MSKPENRTQTHKRTIEVRKSKLQERAYLTGNTELRYCFLVYQGLPDCPQPICRYQVLVEPALHALSSRAVPVEFHEMVSETGEHFAYPIMLIGIDETVPGDWQHCEVDVSLAPLYHWLVIDSEAPNKFFLSRDCQKIKSPTINPNFRKQLDAALAYFRLEQLTDPTVEKLLSFVDEGNHVCNKDCGGDS